MENINIEEIMEQIRADIKERGLKDDEILFDSVVTLSGGAGNVYSHSGYKDVLKEVDTFSEVQSYRELHGNFIERFIKKVIRRLVAFYVESIVDDQNLFNKNVYSGMVMNYNKFQADDERMNALEKKLYQCEKRIAELEKKLQESAGK